MQFFYYTPIPKVFHSFELDALFKECLFCKTDLMEEGTNYLIEKAFKKSEVIFEYAMCFDCRTKVQAELSKQSRKLIDNYFNEHLDLDEHREEMLETYGHDVAGWISHCLIKGTPVKECNEYQIYGLCVDRDIMLTGLPYALSGEAIDDIIQLLSSESLGVIEEFSMKLFDLDIPAPVLIL